jgi:hypothetical protein
LFFKVAHAVENEREDHSANSWQLLTPQASGFVRMREQNAHIAYDRSWSCTHCAAHFENYVTRAMAMAHVRETLIFSFIYVFFKSDEVLSRHSIDEPAVDEDIFYFPGPGIQHTLHVPTVLPQKSLAEFACNKCTGTRLFSLRNLMSHLRDKYVSLQFLYSFGC